MKQIIGILVILVVVTAGWHYLTKPKTDNNEEVMVKVAVFAPFTGVFAGIFGDQIRQGVLDGAGSNIEFIFEDTKCESVSAVSAFRKAVNVDDVQFIIGPVCGASQEPVIPLIKDRDVLAIVNLAANRNFYSQSGEKTFQIQYALQDESAFIAEQMFDRGYENVVLVSYQNAFSKVHSDTFKDNFKGEVVGELVFAGYERAVASEILKIKQWDVDAIFVTDISFFIADGLAKLEDIEVDVPIFSQYGTELSTLAGLNENVIYSFPDGIEGTGAMYSLARNASEILSELVKECDGEYQCALDNLRASNDFDEYGIINRNIILKQIHDGVGVRIEE